jgi:NitT/TauT family transport system substrate-binding protein
MRSIGPDLRRAATAALTGLAMVMASAASAEPEVKVIRFVGVPSAGSMIVWVARDQGFFKEEGIDLRAASDLAAGLVTDNILGGEADMVYGGATAMLIPYAKGAPLVSIAHTDHTALWELIVHGDSPYKTLADLKGKSISMIAPNSQCALALRAMFDRNGWPKDFLKFTVVAPPDQVAAFGAKRVDGSCVFDPYRLQLIKQFGGRVVWSIREISVGDISGTLIVHRDFAAKNPKTVAAIQRAVGKAAEVANRDPEVVYAALARALKRNVEDVREYALPLYANPPSMPDAVRKIADALYKYGFVPAPIDVAGFDRSVPADHKQ